MDYYCSLIQIILLSGNLCKYIIGVGSQVPRTPFCVVRQGDAATACYDHPQSIETTTDNNTNTCCVENRGRALYIPLPEKKWECTACQELQLEHEWLPSPPCDKRDCNHAPQRFLWFTLSIPNRKIQCLGRSYKDVLHCRKDKSVCSSPAPTTDPVYCFKHRYQKWNSSSWGCPASSLDWEMARDIKECCVTKGRAGYALNIKKWYIGVARLHHCEPCQGNPSSDTIWSQWSACSPGSNCSRRRSMQIPYLENMPDHWCVETITMEEPATPKIASSPNLNQQQEEKCEPADEKGYTVILALAIGGISTSLILAGVLCLVCIRCQSKKRSRANTQTPSQCLPATSKVGDSQTHLIGMNTYTPTPETRKKSLPEIPEQIYERISHCSTGQRKSDATNSEKYMEMK